MDAALSGTANDADDEDGDPDTFNEYLQWAPLDGAQGSYAHTFPEPGEYWYFCHLHHTVGMVGKVVVS